MNSLLSFCHLSLSLSQLFFFSLEALGRFGDFLLPDSKRQLRQAHQVVNTGPVMRILGKHPSYDSLKLFRIAGGDTVKGACLYFHGKTQMILSLKRWPECGQFVYDAPERPNVTLLVVFCVVYLLWAHIVRRADMSVSKLRLSVHHSG